MSESRKGVEVDINIPKADAAQSFAKPHERYQHPDASKPGRPTIVEGDIKPFDVQAKVKPLTIVLQGGPFDGTEVEVPGMAMKYDAVVQVDPATIEPFVFDAEQHRRYVDSGGKEGRANVVQGSWDTVTYKRTNQKTKEGLTIFAAA